MRIRTIKPEFWDSPDMASVSEPALILAIGLLNYSDDEGYFLANAKLIESKIFPLREPSVSVHGALTELSRIGYVQINEGSNGRVYGRVVNFLKHQNVNRASKSKLKQFWSDSEPNLPGFREDSLSTHGDITEPSSLEQGTGNREQGKDYTTSSATPSDGGFDLFWDAYPKKVEKKKCREIWKRKKLGKMSVTIGSDILNRLKKDRKWIEGYIPNPSTYLNGERWEDEIEPLNGAHMDQQNKDYSLHDN